MLGKKIKKLKNWLQGRKDLQDFRVRLAVFKQHHSYQYQVVLISHELSATGAPLMLLNAAKAILADGGSVRVLSYSDGPLRQQFEALGVPVFYHPGFRHQRKLLNEFAGDCDYAVANTVIAYPAINLLKGPKVLWWIHEAQVIDKDYIARFRKKKIRPDLEQTLRQASKLAVVSDYAQEVVAKYNPKTEVINLAVADVAAEKGASAKEAGEKIRFAMIGAVCEIKGQDIVVEAVKMLPEIYRKQAEFYIAGKQNNDFCNRLVAETKHISEVAWLPALDFDTLWDFYRDCDVVMVASRDESFSLVALEACMMSRPLIVSSNVGAKFLVKSGENGEVFAGGDAKSLCQAIISLIDKRNQLPEMGKLSRKQYELSGTLENFYEKFLYLLKK